MAIWKTHTVREDVFAVLDFWFGEASNLDDVDVVQALSKKWFMGGDGYDREIADQFGELTQAALDNLLQDWKSNAAEQLAHILVLDQFPRNLFRGTGRAFAGDARAFELATSLLASPVHEGLHPHEQLFAAMPFQHTESIEGQKESVKLFEMFKSRAPAGHEEIFENTFKHARMHYEIVEQFGRFPHRNKALDRVCTEAEVVYLAGDAPTFGQ